jgi:hypothetical protein
LTGDAVKRWPSEVDQQRQARRAPGGQQWEDRGEQEIGAGKYQRRAARPDQDRQDRNWARRHRNDERLSYLVVAVTIVVGVSEVVRSAGSRRWWALVAVVLAVLAVGMDLTVLSVALPTLSGVLKASETDLQWFSSGYALVLAAAMLPAR